MLELAQVARPQFVSFVIITVQPARPVPDHNPLAIGGWTGAAVGIRLVRGIRLGIFDDTRPEELGSLTVVTVEAAVAASIGSAGEKDASARDDRAAVARSGKRL